MGDCRARIFERIRRTLQVMPQPKIIMPEVSDELAPGFRQPAIVRTGLMAGIFRKIDPSHTRIRYGADHLF